ETPNLPDSPSRSCIFAPHAIETMQSGGVRDPAMKALAVMPKTSPPTSVVTTVTPVAKRLMTFRNRAGGIVLKARCISDSGSATMSLLHHDVNVVGIDQVRHRPAVQVVFGHALLGEAAEFLGLPHHLGGHDDFGPNVLVV